MSKRAILVLYFLFCSTLISFCQNKIDSLSALAKSDKDDSMKVKHLNSLCNAYEDQGAYEKAIEAGKACIELAKTISFGKSMRGEKLNANTLTNLGTCYMYQANYDMALEEYFSALKIYERIRNDKGRAACQLNIGTIYKNQGKLDKALEMDSSALKLFTDIGFKPGIAKAAGTMGTLYMRKGYYNKALESDFIALGIFKELKDKAGISITHNSIASVYHSQGNYGKALENYRNARVLFEELNDKNGVAASTANIGDILLKQNKIPEAKSQLLLSLQVAIEIGAKETAKSDYEALAFCDSISGDWKGAFHYHILFKQINDSIFNIESAKKTAEMTAKYESEKKESQIKLLEKDKEKQSAITLEEKKRQRLFLYSVILILLIVAVFAGFMYNRWKVTQKQKHLIEKQKHLVEEHQKEIIDSINYAERIQRSFIATTEILNENLHDYFVLFKPKDIVSGDFYWASKLNNGTFALATADSTGHGVPGAIMSLLNVTSLEKAIETDTNPSEILNTTRKIIIERLKKDGSLEGGKDGMDTSLTVYDFKTNKLTIAAANNPVWIIRGSETIEIKPDKMPVGKHDRQATSFTQQEIELKQGDVVYTLTDGFPDQFGGEKGKKFMSKNLRELLAANAHLPMQDQKELLEITFKEWVGDLEQIDDVTLIGVRV